MNSSLDRRDFLRTSGVLTVAAAAGATTCVGFAADKPPIFQISLAQWSLNRRFFGREQPTLDNLDFAKTAKGFGIEAIEYVNQFFFDKAKDEKYLAEMNKRAADEGVKQLLIMVDREGDLGDSDESKRKQAVENHHKWAEAAKTLGCHSIRVNARSNPKLSFDEQMKLAADGLRQLTEFAAKLDLNTLVENHGGLSSNGAWLAGVMKLVDHPRVGTLPDFGNFQVENGQWYDRYQGVKELMPFAKAVSAKAYGFDRSKPWISIQEGTGQETDFLKMMRIVLDAGYRGWVGIEAEGGQDQFQGVTQTKYLLERVREKLAAEYS